MRRRLAWILAVPLVVAMTWSVARRGRYTVPFSTWSTSAEGAKALFTFLGETGRRPTRWTQDLGRLPPGGILIAMGEGRPARRLGRREKDALARFVETGGTLFVLGVQDYSPRGIDVRIAPSAQGESAKPAGDAVGELPDFAGDAPADDERPKPEAVSVAEHPLLSGLSNVTLRRPGVIKVDEPGAEILLGDPKSPLGVAVPHGRGWVVEIASASFVTNSDLGAGDHAPFVARLVDRYRGGGRVLFDEYHLGMGSGRSVVSYLRARGLGPLLVQLVLVVAMLLLRVAVRFGAPQPAVAPPPDDAASYVEGMGRIYARASDVPASVDRVARDAWARLAAKHGLSPPAGAASLAEALRRRGRTASAGTVDAIEARRASTLARGRLGAADLVSFTRHVDRMMGPEEERTR